MRKLLLTLGFMISLSAPTFGLINRAYAVDVVSPACQNADPDNLPAVCKTQAGGDPLFGPDGILTTVVNILSIIAGIVAVFVIMIGGAKMITSAGDSKSVQEARNAVLYAVVSLVIVASAQILVRFVLDKIG